MRVTRLCDHGGMSLNELTTNIKRRVQPGATTRTEGPVTHTEIAVTPEIADELGWSAAPASDDAPSDVRRNSVAAAMATGNSAQSRIDAMNPVERERFEARVNSAMLGGR